MHYYIGLGLLLIVLFGYIRFINEKWNYNFGGSLFLSLITIMFLMSIFSLLNILLIGFWIAGLFGFIYFWYSLFRSIICKNKFFSPFLSPLFVIFIIFLFIFIIFSRKINIMMNWDECSYWGTMVKKLFYFNSYIGKDNFYSMYYPPALTSYNYFIVKFLGMKDSSIYFSQYLFIFSGIIFLIRNIKWNQILIGICGIFCGWVYLILLLSPFLLTIYSEIPLILISGISIILLFTAQNKIDYVFVSMMLACATLIKSNGIVVCFVVLLIALFQFIYILINKYTKGEKFIPYFLKQLISNKYLFLVMLSPLLARFAFNLFLYNYNISNPQSLNGGIIEFLKMIIYNNDITNNFLNALSTNYNYSSFNVSSIVMVSMLIIGFIKLRNIYEDKDERINKNKYIGFAYLLGFIVYSTALLYSYYFLFSSPEAKNLASFDRYINTYIGTIGIGFIGVILYYSDVNEKKIAKQMTNYIIAITLFLFSVTNVTEVGRFVKNFIGNGNSTSVEQIKKGKDIALMYKSHFNSNDKIHLIAQEDYGMTIWATIYYMTPLKIYDPRFEGDNWSLRIPKSEEIANTIVMSPEDYLTFLKNKKFTDVIVIKSNNNFSKQYGSIFETNNNGYIEEGIYHFDMKKKKLIFEV